MKALPINEQKSRERQLASTGTARLYPIGHQVSGYSLDELIERSEQMTEVLKHCLVFPLSPPKKTK